MVCLTELDGSDKPELMRMLIGLGLALHFTTAEGVAESTWEVPLQSRVTQVQPLTGIVLWSTHEKVATDAVQLEFAYVRYSDIVTERGRYDWRVVEALLDGAARRGHQMILRFYFVYPGKEAAVPTYLRALSDYREVKGKSEGKETTFCDWSHRELQRFALGFYTAFAERYDRDPRLAYVQTGFGLWAEYHIYDGPMELGRTFPDLAYQATFARHLAKVLVKTPWTISVDAANEWAPFVGDRGLLGLGFGVVDDSFLCKQHARENEPNWDALDRQRWQRTVAGGEFSYYTRTDQKLALAVKGPHGRSFEQAAAAFHLSFIIGNDQPSYQPMDRLREAGLACGYRFRVTRFVAGAARSEVTIENVGIAPLYHDAVPAVNGRRAAGTLKGLLPGQSRTFKMAAGGRTPSLSIESERLLPGQRIGFEADLK
jgi:hypothetical protein